MPTQKSYRKWLKQNFNTMVEQIDLSDLQKQFLRSRWLGQVLWMEGKADNAHTMYYILKLTAIIGGVIVPALAGLNFIDHTASAYVYIRWTTFGISLLVAISLAVEGVFNYGERWRHYRKTVELLKIEGWQFFQLSGPYQQFDCHEEAYTVFAGRVEEDIKSEVQDYITKVVQEKDEDKGGRS